MFKRRSPRGFPWAVFFLENIEIGDIMKKKLTEGVVMEEQNIHIHTFEEIIVPASCKENGYTLHRCACGYEHKDHFTPLAQHNFQFVDQQLPGCCEEGVQNFRCAVCGETASKPLAALGHDRGQWSTQAFATCEEDGLQVRVCSRCGEMEKQTLPAIGHKLVNPKPSEAEEGMMEYFCENCGHTVVKPIEKKKGFFARHWRSLTAAAICLVLLAGLAVSIPLFILPLFEQKSAENPLDVQYNKAVQLLEDGKYKEAYYALKDCDGYKDSEELLKNFRIEYEESFGAEYDKDGNVTHERKSTYKDHESYTLEIEYDEDGNVSWKIEYAYDDNGHQTLDSYYARYDEYEYFHKSLYEYDSNGKLTQEIRYDADGNVIWKYEYEYAYDDKGNETLKIRYDADGNVNWKYEYEYDDKGNKTLEIQYDADENVNWKYEYSYDDKGNNTLKICYDEDGNVDYKYEYEYDDRGNKALEICYDEDGNVRSKYEYDDRGYTTFEIHYDEDGNITLKFQQKFDEQGNINYWYFYDSISETGKITENKKTYQNKYDEYDILTEVTGYDEIDKSTMEATYKGPIFLYEPKEEK